MKTLDEVIFEAPYSPTPWEADALLYLKKLKRIEAKIEKIATGNVEDVLSKMDNPPLTWSELKLMKGKPVWVVEEGYQTWEYWSLVYWMKDDELTLLNENGQTTYSKNEQGTVWQAYRKEQG